MMKNGWLCGLAIVVGANAALAEKVDPGDVKKIISAIEHRGQGYTGELEAFEAAAGQKVQVAKVGFCFSAQSSWFKVDQNDGKDHVHGFDGKAYFSRHGSEVTLTAQKAYSNSWRLDYLLQSLTPNLEQEKAPLALVDALAGMGDYQIDCTREDANLVVGLSKFVGKLPTGNDKFEIYRVVIRESDGRILEKNRLVQLRSEKVGYYVPITTTVFHYENPRTPLLPSRVRVLAYDMSKSGEPNDHGIEQTLAIIPVVSEWEYVFRNLKPVMAGDAAISRYALKKGDTVYDVPKGGLSYEVK